ncbi:MAG: 3-deoxy-7-phosphoheptulonate synthase [Candidatus Anstonellales archaeon]
MKINDCNKTKTKNERNQREEIKKLLKNKPILIAGPCAIEDQNQIIEIANKLKTIGINFLRGGAYKPRTNPNSFQGLGELGLKFLQEAKSLTKLMTVSEIVDPRHVELFYKYDIDILQIGSRNMANYELLKEVAKTDKYILLKRGMCATLEEFLGAIEYIRKENNNLLLVERGIKAYGMSSRNILDLGIVNVLKNLDETKDLPILIDPSHAAGKRELVINFALAGISAKADGLIVEVHNNPEMALSDREQQLTIKEFETLVKKVKQIYRSLNLPEKF